MTHVNMTGSVCMYPGDSSSYSFILPAIRQQGAARGCLADCRTALGQDISAGWVADDFLACLAKFPPFSLSKDGFVTTADPALAKMVFNSRAHSVGRAWPYRLMPQVFPDSDGILFLGDDAWRMRHSALTPLFTGSNVQRFARAMLRAAFSVAHRNAVACAVAPTSPTGPVMSPAVPRRLGDGTAYDLLAATRCVSKRVLLEWGLGIAADSAEGAALGATLDSYARTVLEVLPGSPLTKALSAYARSFSLRSELRRQVCAAMDTAH